MGPKTILITGANRGIGLEFVKQLLKLSPKTLIATCRRPDEAKELQEIAKQNTSLKVIKLDVQDEASIKDVRQKTEAILGKEGLNLLINNAGIHLDCSSIENVDATALAKNYSCNVIGPALMCREFLPLLKCASSNYSQTTAPWERAAILNISSLLGSVTESTFKQFYHYSTTKAALNMMTKTLSLELEPSQILVIAVHPGWVLTDMGGPGAPVTTLQSVEGILKLMQSLELKNSGKLYEYTGREMAW